MSQNKFDIIIDESFSSCCSDESLTPTSNKSVLSFTNDFEEGKWRHKKFLKFIWDNVAETALTEEERTALIGNPATILSRAASRMRLTDNETSETTGAGSELAEIFLYGIMRKHFGALPVVPKIFYKQNARDNAKGADSVHITTDADDFQIWYGEAKFFNSIEDNRLGSIIDSVKNSLEALKIRKENSIITGTGDLDQFIPEGDLLTEIKRILDEDTPIDEFKQKLHVPIFLLHECPITQGQSTMTDEFREKLAVYHRGRANSFFKKQIKKLRSVHLYEQIRFTLIIFPVPQKSEIVDNFIQAVEFYKTQ